MSLIAIDASAPRWALVINGYADQAAARGRSWDLWSDVASPAYDDLLAGPVNDLVGAVCALVEYLGGMALEPSDRARIGAGVRQWGKVYVRGLFVAVGATDEFRPRAWCLYAAGVARRTVAEHRARRATSGFERSPAVQLAAQVMGS